MKCSANRKGIYISAPHEHGGGDDDIGATTSIVSVFSDGDVLSMRAWQLSGVFKWIQTA